jgi:hypothetical protein
MSLQYGHRLKSAPSLWEKRRLFEIYGRLDSGTQRTIRRILDDRMAPLSFPQLSKLSTIGCGFKAPPAQLSSVVGSWRSGSKRCVGNVAGLVIRGYESVPGRTLRHDFPEKPAHGRDDPSESPVRRPVRRHAAPAATTPRRRFHGDHPDGRARSFVPFGTALSNGVNIMAIEDRTPQEAGRSLRPTRLGAGYFSGSGP